MFAAQAAHRQYFQPGQVQLCQLLSVKTGGCPEDCAYCPQSAHYETEVGHDGLLSLDHVMKTAREAREQGVTRFCMGAAWRQVSDGPEFESILQMVRGVSSLGLEVCCTLGMLNQSQADRLADAGLFAYNHNLDTSANITVRLSPREIMKTGCERSSPCAKPGLRFAAAVSSEWVSRMRTGSACSTSSRP